MKGRAIIYPSVYEKNAVTALTKVNCLTATYSHNFDGFGTRAYILDYEEILPNLSDKGI